MALLQLEPGFDSVSVKVTVTELPQSSMAVTVAVEDGTSPRHWKVPPFGSGQPDNVVFVGIQGGVSPEHVPTVTVKAHVAVWAVGEH